MKLSIRLHDRIQWPIHRIMQRLLSHYLQGLNSQWVLSAITTTRPTIAPEPSINITAHPRRLRASLPPMAACCCRLLSLVSPQGCCIRARWYYQHDEQDATLPVAIWIDPNASRRPRIEGTLDSTTWQRLMAKYCDRHSQGEHALLGYYTLEQCYRFDTLQISSIPISSAGPVTQRQLLLQATGSVRINATSAILSPRTTLTIKRLCARCDITITPGKRRLELNYHLDIAEMNISARRIAPWLERKIARRLRRALQQACNRDQHRRNRGTRQLPSWLPVDADLNFTVAPTSCAD